MLLLKGCPKCHGDLLYHRNEFDEDEAYCLQCGFRKYEVVAETQMTELSYGHTASQVA